MSTELTKLYVQPETSATITPQPRTLVREMPEYHPPLAAREALRLDFNENTLAPSPRVIEVLQAITAEGLTIYPERGHTEAIVAPHFNLSPDQVLLTNGVDEAIHLLCLAFLEADDEALIVTPSFFMYDVSASAMTSHLVRVQAEASLEFPFERLLAAITPRTKIIFLANPNNPTGQTIPREQVLAIAAAAPHAVIFCDEAYYHFYGATTMQDVGHIPNLIVGRTFSKAYGLANLRCGMLAGSANLMTFLRKVSSPYNVNGIALAVLPAALGDQAYIDWYVTQVAAGRERIQQALSDLQVRYFRSASNFILFEIGSKHAEFVQRMREKGVLVRDRSADPGCDGYVRITVGIEAHVTQAMQALHEVLDEMRWSHPEH